MVISSKEAIWAIYRALNEDGFPVGDPDQGRNHWTVGVESKLHEFDEIGVTIEGGDNDALWILRIVDGYNYWVVTHETTVPYDRRDTLPMVVLGRVKAIFASRKITDRPEDQQP